MEVSRIQEKVKRFRFSHGCGPAELKPLPDGNPTMTVKMKIKMMLLALPLALDTMPLYAAALQTGVINRDALEAPIQTTLVNGLNV
jgi:hypothetical protein